MDYAAESDSLFDNLKHCAHQKSSDSLAESADQESLFLCEYFKMFAINDETLSLTPNGAFDDNILEDGRISLAYENLKSIPKKIAEKFSAETKVLDLSYNSFRNLSFLSYFQCLHTLILDRNLDLDETSLPFLGSLKILWINNCNITNIAKWVYRIQSQCPQLEQLSMMSNPGAKTLLNGGTSTDHSDYRVFVFRLLPDLLYLDGVSRYSTNACESGVVLDEDPLFASVADEAAFGYQFETTSNFKRFFRFRKRKTSYQSSSTS